MLANQSRETKIKGTVTNGTLRVVTSTEKLYYMNV